MNGCDYLSMMGHSRGCPPCDECVRFEHGERNALIMDEWSVPKTEESESQREVVLYTREQKRRYLQYMAKNHM